MRHLPMKTISVSFLLAGMLLPTVGLADQQPAKARVAGEKGERSEAQRAFFEAWRLANKDHDGFISKVEFDAMPRTLNLPQDKRDNLFKRLDKNGDGKLSREELGHLVKPHDGEGSKMQRLWELDTDKSGGISFEEFKMGQLFNKLAPERQEAVFRRLDSDGDGVVSPKDRPQPPFKHPDGPGGRPPGKPDAPDGPGRINYKLDTNGDGALSFEEFRVGAAVKDLTEDEQEDRFNGLDRNGDLKISPADVPPPPQKDKPE
jgi:Ca2+-binding EF-hand superfamily protein